MIALGYILFWLGFIVCLVGNLMFLAIVFRDSLVWFFGCLFVPVVDLFYFLLHPKQTWKPMVIAAVGCLASITGYCLAGFTFLQ
jgi:hypothetical protein